MSGHVPATPLPWHAKPTGEILDTDGFEIATVQDTPVLDNWAALKIRHWSQSPGRAYRELNEEQVEANALYTIRAANNFPHLLSAAKYAICNGPREVDPKYRCTFCGLSLELEPDVFRICEDDCVGYGLRQAVEEAER